MPIIRRLKKENDGEMMIILTVYNLYKYAVAKRRAWLTAGLMFCNVVTYFRNQIIQDFPRSIYELWLNVHGFVKKKESKRLKLSLSTNQYGQYQFVFNMLKLLWNGVALEPLMGWLEYGSMLCSLSFISQSINFVGRYVLLFAGYEPVHRVGCSITNVMFALDYIRNDVTKDDSIHVFGIEVPKYVSPWVDLFVAKKVGAGDFVGNAGGVVAGALYSKLIKSWIGEEDLITKIIRAIFGLKSQAETQHKEESENNLDLDKIEEAISEMNERGAVINRFYDSRYGSESRDQAFFRTPWIWSQENGINNASDGKKVQRDDSTQVKSDIGEGSGKGRVPFKSQLSDISEGSGESGSEAEDDS